tara:strand:- start:90 stop:332 length:243 start_codon:yes stop_codon:yes gene_type:complete
MSKFLTTAYKTTPESENDEEVVIDLKEVTSMFDPMIGLFARNGVDGIMLMVTTPLLTKYAFFVVLDTFVEFIAWDLGLSD